jgi:pimeloyl-ACP methyl ester carboxylesterase
MLGACGTGAQADPPAAGGPPETVVLLHGLGRGNLAMWRLAGRLENAGFRVVRVGYDSIARTPEEIVAEVSAQIDACCARDSGPVHFAGHSLGGLLIRAYLERNRPAGLGRVVLMGTPNQGTPVVDRYHDRWWLRALGEPALSLGTGPESFPHQLAPPDYPVGVIAGVWEGLENEQVLPGADDGLVPVESTKLAGMTDFIVLETSHAAMRGDETVARQTIHFLRHGRFER